MQPRLDIIFGTLNRRSGHLAAGAQSAKCILVTLKPKTGHGNARVLDWTLKRCS